MGPTSGTTLKLQTPVIKTGCSVDETETQADILSNLTRREERLNRLGKGRIVHADTVVDHFDHNGHSLDVHARFLDPGRNLDAPTSYDRMKSILTQRLNGLPNDLPVRKYPGHPAVGDKADRYSGTDRLLS